MNVINDKSNQELIASILAEVAKANNEIRCASQDVSKAQRRLGFVIALLNTITERENGKTNTPASKSTQEI